MAKMLRFIIIIIYSQYRDYPFEINFYLIFWFILIKISYC